MRSGDLRMWFWRHVLYDVKICQPCIDALHRQDALLIFLISSHATGAWRPGVPKFMQSLATLYIADNLPLNKNCMMYTPAR